MDHAGGVELCGSAVVLQCLCVGARGQVCAEDDADESARYAAQLRHLPVPPGAPRQHMSEWGISCGECLCPASEGWLHELPCWQQPRHFMHGLLYILWRLSDKSRQTALKGPGPA